MSRFPLILCFTATLSLWAGQPPHLAGASGEETVIINQINGMTFEKTGKTYRVVRNENQDNAHQDFIIILKGEPIARQMRQARAKNFPQHQFKAQVQAVAARQKDVRSQLVQELKKKDAGLTLRGEYSYLLNGFAVRGKADQILALRSHPMVESVHVDGVVQAHLDDSVAQVGTHAVWETLDGQGRPVQGQDMVVAVIDSGVDYNHPDLGGGFGPGFKVIGGYDFHNRDDDPMDDHSHGTHVAGIVAGKGGVVGVAPEAMLLAYKVLGETGYGSQSDIISGIERAADPDQDPFTDDAADVMNLSLGGSGDADDLISQAADAAVEAGVVVVASAGNSGANSGALGSPGTARKALTVGAVDKDGGMADFSSRGPSLPFAIKPEISAPGVAIRSTIPDGQYDAYFGTSMAAPHVAGAAALLKQIHPDWEPEQIVKHLIQTATPLEGEDVMAQGAGILNLEAALNESVTFSLKNLSLGRVNPTVTEWSARRLVQVTNPTSQTLALQFSITDHAPEGVSFSLDKESAELGPGESTSLTIGVAIDNETAPYPSNSSLTFGAVLEARSGAHRRVMPLVVRKSIKLDIQFRSGFMFYMLWQDENQVTDGGEEQNFTLHLTPGTYNMMGLYGTYAAPGTDTFLQEDSLVVEQDTLLDLASREIFDITHSWTDEQGEEHQLLGHESSLTHFALTHKPSKVMLLGRSYTPSTPLQSTGHSDTFSIETLAVAHLGDRRFTEIGSYFEGLDGDRHFNTVVADNHKMVYKLPGSDLPGRRSSLFYTSSTPNNEAIRISLMSLTSASFLENPYDLTLYTLPLGEPDPDETWRFTQSSLLTSNAYETWNSPLATTLSKTQWESSRTGDRYHGDVLNLAEGPFFPLVSFSNSEAALVGTTVLYNGSGSYYEPGESTYSLTLPDGQALEGESRFILHALETPPEGEIAYRESFHNRLDGQLREGAYTAWFDINRENPNPPYIHNLRLMRNDGVTSMAPDRLVLSVGDGVEITTVSSHPPTAEALDSVAVFWRVSGDWIELDGQREGHLFTADLPSLEPGLVADLKITASNTAGNRFECEMAEAWRSGATQVIPWVVNNDQWRSRLAVHNPHPQDVSAVLTGVDRVGERRSEAVTVPKGGVYAVDSDQLFGDLTGYSLEIESPSQLETSFLTFNVGAQSGGNSPSLTTGASIQHLNQRLLFPYLPGDQIPAVVLSAPDQGVAEGEPLRETRVKLQLFGEDSESPLEKELVLHNDQPQAWLLSDLFPDRSPNGAWSLGVHSWDGVKLAGSVFSFNQLREPSMAAPLSRGHESTTLQIVPWVVNNPQWESRISVFSQGFQAPVIRFTAVTASGEEEVREIPVDSKSVNVFQAGELFPELSGYSLFMEAVPHEGAVWFDGQISASFMTFNKEAASGGNSPSQTTAVQPYEPADTLVFSYLPGDQISALVLTAPEGEGETPVTLTLYNEAGLALDQAQAVLSGKSPKAALLTDLFPNVSIPRDSAVKAVSESGRPITGTAFIFNDQREPSMTRPVGGR